MLSFMIKKNCTDLFVD